MKKSSMVRHPMIETLESRQLLAAVVDVRLPGGGKAVSDPTVGQTINVEVWVTVTGTDNNISNEKLQIAAGSLLSSDISGGSVRGTLTSVVQTPFDANGSQNGTQTDLDGDGDLDVGSNDPSTANGYLFARSADLHGAGTAVTKGQAFKIATATFQVTSLLSGTETDLVFRPRGTTSTFIYQQDGVAFNSPAGGGSFTAGTGVAIRRTPNSTISGRVFNDLNANGVFDGVDTGISGFRVFLDANANAILDPGEISKPVSGTGTYTFSAVPPGTYRVREVFRQGWRQSFPALGYYELTIGFDQAAKTLSFANTDTVLIKGRVFMDADKDGTLDPAEGGLPDWFVYLDTNNNGVHNKGEAVATSDANGNYRFFNIPAGKYIVRIIPQTGFKQTAPGGHAHTITLGAGATVSNKNFGEKRLK